MCLYVRELILFEFVQLHDTATLRVLKTYTTETPLNSAAIAPLKPYVCREILSSFHFSLNPLVGPLRRWSRSNECHDYLT